MMDFSVIIPQKNSVKSLRRLIDSIPDSERIEIIVVDNSPEPITKEEIGIDRNYNLLWASPERYAGGARNVGIDNATGKWLIFADADDFFEEKAFDIFYSFFDSDSEIIYFCANSIYSESGAPASRGEIYTNLVCRYLSREDEEFRIRYGFNVPWAKMIKKGLIERKNIRFDEVIAANDAFFSVLIGYYAIKISASKESVYIVTVSEGSLTRRKDNLTLLSRYVVALRLNNFLKAHGFPQYQQSVMIYIKQSTQYGLRTVCHFISLLIKYHQNPFVGWKNWYKTAFVKNNK